LVNESQLDPAITPQGLPMADIFNPSGIFLTGATGYLGIFLLEQLIQETKANVYCLVRGANEQESRTRLKQTADIFKVKWTAEFDRRVKLMPETWASRCSASLRSSLTIWQRTLMPSITMARW